MEIYTVFLDWKNQYCSDDSTTQGNLQIQCNPYQITNGISYFSHTKSRTIGKCHASLATEHSRILLFLPVAVWHCL